MKLLSCSLFKLNLCMMWITKGYTFNHYILHKLHTFLGNLLCIRALGESILLCNGSGWILVACCVFYRVALKIADKRQIELKFSESFVAYIAPFHTKRKKNNNCGNDYANSSKKKRIWFSREANIEFHIQSFMLQYFHVQAFYSKFIHLLFLSLLWLRFIYVKIAMHPIPSYGLKCLYMCVFHPEKMLHNIFT